MFPKKRLSHGWLTSGGNCKWQLCYVQFHHNSIYQSLRQSALSLKRQHIFNWIRDLRDMLNDYNLLDHTNTHSTWEIKSLSHHAITTTKQDSSISIFNGTTTNFKERREKRRDEARAQTPSEKLEADSVLRTLRHPAGCNVASSLRELFNCLYLSWRVNSNKVN